MPETSNAKTPKVIHVIVATPFGKGARGGIDRMMDNIRDELSKHPQESINVRFLPTRGSGHILLSLVYFASFLSLLIVLRALGKCDLVHINVATHGSVTRKIIIGGLCNLLGVPFVIHLHGGRFIDFFAGASRSRQIRIVRFFKGAQRIIVLGKVWKDFVVDDLNVHDDRVEILRNAVPIPEFHEQSRGRNPALTQILFLGALGKDKGIPELLDALAQIEDQPKWSATLAGNGAIAEVKSSLVAKGLQGRVEVPGWLPQSEVQKLLGRADILVLPSHIENLPMSVIEAMAHNLAIVATPVGSVAEIITNGETGLLVPVGNANELAKALQRVVSDNDLRTKLGQAAGGFHKKHLEIGRYVKRICDLWKASAR
jgi:glycosyltransferase involved in cell wall biosynthesis